MIETSQEWEARTSASRRATRSLIDWQGNARRAVKGNAGIRKYLRATDAPRAGCATGLFEKMRERAKHAA
jgi:hypothetical protein